MEPWYKFILYGTYDGFSRSTLGDDNLYLVLENGEKVEVPRCFVKNASDFIEKDKIKLKDVIARIQKLDIGTQKVWINEILNELGSDYGTLKYKDGYEQGKLEGEWVGQQLKDADKIRQELNRPVVPQFVADWIEEGKKHCKDVSDLFDFNFTNKEVGNWFLREKPFDLVARAWLDGYEIEKEKRFLVKMKGVDSRTNYLYYGVGSKTWLFKAKLIDGNFRKSHTRKELEQDNFGWVFDCPGIEIEVLE